MIYRKKVMLVWMKNLNTDIDIYGSRQKRSHSSLNDARENKKVIDYKVFSRSCKSYALWKSKKVTEEYISWKKDHGEDYEINDF